MVSVPDHTGQEKSVLKRALVTAAAALGMGLAFDTLFFEKLPGISFPIYTVLTISVLLLAAHLGRRKLPRTALFMIPLLLFFSSMVFVRTGELVTFLNIVTTLYLLALFATLSFKPALPKYNFRDYLNLLIDLPAEVLAKAKAGLSSLALQRRFVAKHKALPQVLRGVIIAVPVLVLFGTLFASADLVFRQYIVDVFSFQFNAELFWRTVLVFAVAYIFTGLIALFVSAPKAKEVDSQKTAKSRYGLVEATILFGSLNGLFLLFIIVQLAYLFGGTANIEGGFTYAEYARKGFFELIAVAGLSLALIFVAERMLLREGEKHSLRFKLLSGALVVQVAIIMVSAIKRLNLYQDAYGFTSLRLYSYIFIVWLAVVFGLLAYKIFADRRENTFAFAVFASLLVFLASVNFLNADGFVARKNIERYQATGKLDIRYLGTLSNDAVPEVAKLLDSDDPKVRGAAASVLYPKYLHLKDSDSSWQSANLSRNAALRALEPQKQLLEQNENTVLESEYIGPGQE